jgi:hypothetical protein
MALFASLSAACIRKMPCFLDKSRRGAVAKTQNRAAISILMDIGRGAAVSRRKG